MYIYTFRTDIQPRLELALTASPVFSIFSGNLFPHNTAWSVCAFRNDVPRVAQRYGTIAAHTRRRASVLVVFVVVCVHMYRFAGLIRRTPPPAFSDTAITDRHSDTTNFQLRAHWDADILVYWIGKNRTCPRWESNPRLPACKASTLSTRPGSLLYRMSEYRMDDTQG